MITALISAVTGLLSGVVPDLLKEFKETRSHKREMEFTQLNHQLALERAKLEVSAKLEETQEQRMMAEVAAAKEQLVAAITVQGAYHTGIGWIDGFNALIRPTTALIFVFMFAVGLCGYSFGLVHNDAFGTTLVSLFGESVQAVIGFMFGARAVATSKKLATA
jgi:hypothetical protein